MNKEELQWLKEISITTGISYSGDQTITTAFANKIINYIEQLEQENNQLKEQYQEYKETEDERGIVLTSYTIDKLNELSGE